VISPDGEDVTAQRAVKKEKSDSNTKGLNSTAACQTMSAEIKNFQIKAELTLKGSPTAGWDAEATEKTYSKVRV